ncbi:MAG: DEAD/DEAH box helicase family protein [Candidatus Thermoplasmatota archaeon]|nr:DEAD/DEAH box helicase family protein [Candidatus Thermoplasmatota archaeon]
MIDEFHHAASTSYQKLLEYYHPRVLMGLTATSGRMGKNNILPYF